MLTKNEIIETLITIKDTYKLRPSEIKAINDACNMLETYNKLNTKKGENHA